MVLVSGKIECFSRIFSFLSPLPRHDWEAIRNIATGQSWISCIPISNILYPSPYLGPISQSHTGARRGVFFCSRIKPDLNAPYPRPISQSHIQSQILGKKTDIHHLISAGYPLVADITAYRSNCTSVQCRRQGCIGKNFFLNILYKKIVVQL